MVWISHTEVESRSHISICNTIYPDPIDGSDRELSTLRIHQFTVFQLAFENKMQLTKGLFGKVMPLPRFRTPIFSTDMLNLVKESAFIALAFKDNMAFDKSNAFLEVRCDTVCISNLYSH